MAGARGSTPRQLVARGRNRRRAASWQLEPALARRVVRCGIALASTMLLLGIVTPWCTRLVRTHPYFAVHEIAVRHRGRLETESIRALAGIETGTNVWDVDPEAVETRLLTNGWIRTALVRRELPDRVVLHVREHRPVAILAVADERPGLYYLAANGRIFAPIGAGDARDLPFVTGLTRKDLAGNDAFGPRAVRRALALLRYAGRRPAVGPASEVHVDRDAGLSLMPVRPTLAVEIGWGEYEAKLARLAEVLPSWSGREAEVRSVSCVFRDEVIVRTRVRRADEGSAGPKPGATRRTPPRKRADKPSASGA